MTGGLAERIRLPFSAWEWAPAAVLGVWAVADLATSDSVVGSRAMLVIATALGAAILAARRRGPLVVLLSLAVVLLTPSALGSTAQSAPVVFMLVVAVFTVGRYGRTPWSYLGLPLGVAIAVAGSAADPRETLASSWAWSLNVVWIFGLGLWLREADRRVEETRRRADADRRAAAAEERLRVARDLHDVLAHSLTLMVVQAEVADELLDSDVDRARSALGSVQTAGREALRETRRVLTEMRTTPREGGDTERLARLVDLFRSAGLPVDLDVPRGLHLSPGLDEVVYRMVQESLTNVLRHCGTVATTVALSVGGGRLAVLVSNVGNEARTGSVGSILGGPDSGDVGSGHGLAGMRERVEACGGVLSAGASDGGGFAVRAVLPWDGVERGVGR